MFVGSVATFDKIREGCFGGDEFWLTCDCIPTDTNIIAESGIEKADNIFFNNPVYSVDFDSKTLMPTEVMNMGKRLPHNGEKLLKISTRNREVVVSKNHRFFVIQRNRNFWARRKKNKVELKITEKRAEELKANDRVLIVSRIPEPKRELIDYKTAQLIGYISADGNIEFPHRCAIHIDDSSLECLKKYERIAKALGFNTSIHKHKESNCYRLRLFGKEKILELINKIDDSLLKGCTSRIVDVPSIITKSNNKVLSAYIRGFFDGEANVRIDKSLTVKFGRIMFAIKNKKIIEKIKYLLLRFGIESSNIKNIKNNCHKEFHYITIRDSLSLKRFKKYICFSHPKKKLMLRMIPTSFKTKRRIFKDLEVGFITKIEEINPTTKYLVDFSIPYYENYVANGFVLHNSRSHKWAKVIIANILSRSRKRILTIYYTTQLLSSIDPRVRKITDFVAYPLLNTRETVAKIIIFRGGKFAPANYMRTIYFDTKHVFECFNTNEEVVPWSEDEYEPTYPEDGRWLFQPSMAEEMKEFNSWEEADEYARNYWKGKKVII